MQTSPPHTHIIPHPQIIGQVHWRISLQSTRFPAAGNPCLQSKSARQADAMDALSSMDGKSIEARWDHHGISQPLTGEATCFTEGIIDSGHLGSPLRCGGSMATPSFNQRQLGSIHFQYESRSTACDGSRSISERPVLINHLNWIMAKHQLLYIFVGKMMVC